jgi:hypothetical protein
MNGPNILATINAKQNTDVRLMLVLDVKGGHFPKVLINGIIAEVDFDAGSFTGYATTRPPAVPR